jgi:hypothetical protein
MTINIISYAPGGGGNHLKNLVDLGGKFCNQWPWEWVQEQYIGLKSYYEPQEFSGAVHSLPGRNIHEVFIEQIQQQQDREYLLHGHFGEIAPYADIIRTWGKVRWLILTIDDAIDRDLLRARQQRLGYHPYWLDEEQIFLYRSKMYQYYFNANIEQIHLLPLHDLWNRNMVNSDSIKIIESAVGVEIDRNSAEILHNKWCDLNFDCQNT